LEEQTLEQWILAMIGRGLPVGLQSIRSMANLLLLKRVGVDEVQAIVVGQKWVYNYIQLGNTTTSVLAKILQFYEPGLISEYSSSSPESGSNTDRDVIRPRDNPTDRILL
jgi:hypothetical protein